MSTIGWHTRLQSLAVSLHSIVNGILFLATVAACDKTPALPPKLIMQGWKSLHQNARVENTGVEIAAPECKAGNCGRRKSMESEGFKNVVLTILAENCVMILAYLLAYCVDSECSVWHETRKLTRTLLLHKGGLSRGDFLGAVKVNQSRLTQ